MVRSSPPNTYSPTPRNRIMNIPLLNEIRQPRVLWNSLLIFTPLIAIIALMSVLMYSQDKAFHLLEIKAVAKKAMSDKDQCLSNQTVNIINDLRFVADQITYSDLINKPDEQKNRQLEQTLISLANAKKNYDQLRFIDNNGMEILRINFDRNKGAWSVSKELLQNKRDRYYFQKAIMLKPYALYVSPFDLNIENNAVEQPIKPTLRFAMPVAGPNGKIKGIAIINYLGNELIDRFSEYGGPRNNSLMLVNPEGYFLYGSPDDNNWGFMYHDAHTKKTFADYFPAEWKTIRDNEEGQFITSDGLFTFRKIYPIPQDAGTNAQKYFWTTITHIPDEELRNLLPGASSYILFTAITSLIILTISLLLMVKSERNRRSRKALENLHDELQALYEHSPNHIIICTPEGELQMANKAASDFHGLSSDTIRGKRFKDLLPSSVADAIIKNLHQVATTRKPAVILDRIRKDGTVYSFQSVVFPISAEGEKPFKLGISSIDLTKRENALIQLQESQRKLQALLSNLPGMAYRCLNTPEWPMEFVSDGAFALTGYRPQELTDIVNRLSFSHLIASKDCLRLWQEVQDALQKKQPFSLRYELIQKTGKQIHVHEQGCGVYDRSGNLIALEGFIMNITDQVLFQKQIQEKEARFRTLFEGAPDAIFLADCSTGIITGVNRKASELLGKELPEIVGKHFTTLHWPDERHIAEAAFIAARQIASTADATSQPQQFNVLHKSGRKIPVEIISQKIQLGNREIFYGTFRDITLRRQAEEALQAKTLLLETVTGSLPAYISMKDRNLRYTYANSYALNKFDLTPEEVKGKCDADLFPHQLATLYSADDREVLETTTPLINKEEELALPDGTVIPVLTNKTPLISNNTVKGIVCVSMDRTEQKKVEEKTKTLQTQLHNSQKMETLGTLSGGIAHDFNNILTPIIGFTEIAIRSLPSESETIKDLDTVLRAARRAKKLVQQMLTFSRKDPPRLVIQPLSPIVEESLDLMQPSIPEKVSREIDIEPFQEMVLCDAAQIEQVIINLCTNALQAMDKENGTLRISLKKKKITNKNIVMCGAIEPDKDYALFTVGDSGRGMSEEERKKMFDPFFTTKPAGKGTGLGLSVVYGIIEEHNGAISVQTRKGSGSEITIYIPLLEDTEQPEKTLSSLRSNKSKSI